MEIGDSISEVKVVLEDIVVLVRLVKSIIKEHESVSVSAG